MNNKFEVDVEIREKINSYKYIAKTALNQYPIIPEKIKFLSHSDHLTFCINTSSENFLLRIHQPVSKSDDNIWKQPKIIESKLMWLAALQSEDNYDIASALQYLTSSVRACFLKGYETIRQLPENYIEIVEAFFIVAVIDIFSNHFSNPKEHQWLA